jgi:hypothetical protein
MGTATVDFFCWIDGTIDSAFNEDIFRLFEGVATTLDGPPILLPSFEDDHLGPPPAQSGDGEHIDMTDFTANVSKLSLNAGSDDLYVIYPLSRYPSLMTTEYGSFDPTYQTAYRGYSATIATPVCRRI